MRRWNHRVQTYVESPKEVEDFLQGYKALCEKHQLTLSHEDGHGGFIIENYNQQNVDWVNDASIDIKE